MVLVDDSFLDMVRDIRSIPGRDIGIRPHRVYLVEANSDGTYPGDGTITETETEILEGNNQPPKVKQVNDEQRALGGLASGALNIGPITPPSALAGITTSDLNASSLANQTDSLRIRVSGPIGNNLYRITSKTLHSATKWMLTVEPVSEVPA